MNLQSFVKTVVIIGTVGYVVYGIYRAYLKFKEPEPNQKTEDDIEIEWRVE